METYEIWRRNLSLAGTDYEPVLIGEQAAKDFETACLKFRLRSLLQHVEELEEADNFKFDSVRWLNNCLNRSCLFEPQAYQSKEEALKSFNH